MTATAMGLAQTARAFAMRAILVLTVRGDSAQMIALGTEFVKRGFAVVMRISFLLTAQSCVVREIVHTKGIATTGHAFANQGFPKQIVRKLVVPITMIAHSTASAIEGCVIAIRDSVVQIARKFSAPMIARPMGDVRQAAFAFVSPTLLEPIVLSLSRRFRRIPLLTQRLGRWLKSQSPLSFQERATTTTNASKSWTMLPTRGDFPTARMQGQKEVVSSGPRLVEPVELGASVVMVAMEDLEALEAMAVLGDSAVMVVLEEPAVLVVLGVMVALVVMEVQVALDQDLVGSEASAVVVCATKPGSRSRSVTGRGSRMSRFSSTSLRYSVGTCQG